MSDQHEHHDDPPRAGRRPRPHQLQLPYLVGPEQLEEERGEVLFEQRLGPTLEIALVLLAAGGAAVVAVVLLAAAVGGLELLAVPLLAASAAALLTLPLLALGPLGRSLLGPMLLRVRTGGVRVNHLWLPARRVHSAAVATSGYPGPTDDDTDLLEGPVRVALRSLPNRPSSPSVWLRYGRRGEQAWQLRVRDAEPLVAAVDVLLAERGDPPATSPAAARPNRGWEADPEREEDLDRREDPEWDEPEEPPWPSWDELSEDEFTDPVSRQRQAVRARRSTLLHHRLLIGPPRFADEHGELRLEQRIGASQAVWAPVVLTAVGVPFLLAVVVGAGGTTGTALGLATLALAALVLVLLAVLLRRQGPLLIRVRDGGVRVNRQWFPAGTVRMSVAVPAGMRQTRRPTLLVPAAFRRVVRTRWPRSASPVVWMFVARAEGVHEAWQLRTWRPGELRDAIDEMPDPWSDEPGEWPA